MEQRNSQDRLKDVVELVVRAVGPTRVYLFGSAARGNAGADSDVDILVVMPPGSHRRQTAMRLYRELLTVGFAVDLVVVTEDDVVRYHDAPGMIVGSAVDEGRLLYAA